MAALRHFVPMRVFIILIFTAFTTGALAQCPKNPVIFEELDEAYRSLSPKVFAGLRCLPFD